MTGDHDRLDDEQAHRQALACLAALVGEDCVGGVCWDPDHRLRGHVEVRGEELVVIAARDVDHRPHVLSAADWDALRHGELSLA